MKRPLTIVALAAVVTAGLLASYPAAFGEREREHREDREHAERRERREHRERDEHRDTGEFDLEVAEIRVAQVHAMLGLLEAIGDASFNPRQAALMAMGTIKDDVDLPGEQKARIFEQMLQQTRSLGLRNAIRLSLKDMYLETGQKEKLIGLMREMIAENDAVLHETGQGMNHAEHEDDEEGEDDEDDEDEDDEKEE